MEVKAVDKRNAKIKVRLFGLNKKQVDKQFRDKDKNYRRKLEALRYQIDVIKEKNKQLKDEFNALEKEEITLTQSEKLVEFCYVVSKKIFTLIDQNSENEIIQITNRGQELECVYDKKIQEYSAEIKKTKEQLNTLLSVVVNKSENFYEDVKDFTQKYSTNIVKENIEEKYEGANQASQKSYKESLLSHKEILENENTDKVETEQQGDSSGFWGEDFSEDVKTEDTKQETTEETKEETKGEEINKKNEVEEVNETKKENLKSKAVSGEIENLRYKYLVGKIAGEDIYNNKNNIIIPKNTEITTDIITIAEKEGKLSELIINMIFPENN
jgi:hypothetical protein